MSKNYYMFLITELPQIKEKMDKKDKKDIGQIFNEAKEKFPKTLKKLS